MNLTPDDSASLVEEVNAVVGKQNAVQVCVCPPFTSLPVVSEKVEQSEVLLGAQNMHAQQSGAYTGEVSAEMLRSLYVSHVILGHSELPVLWRNQCIHQFENSCGHSGKPETDLLHW